MAVRYYNDDCVFRLKDKRKIAAWVKNSVEAEGFVAGDISYIFCSRERHLQINHEYLTHDYPTDVITFDYSDLIGTGVVSGDIFIDPRTVRDNSLLFGVTAHEEMLRVIIHGVLHLCGYKDKTRSEASIMRTKEDHYLLEFLPLPRQRVKP